MKKVMKQLFRNGLCGLLCAAMVLTSLSIPEMTVYAAQIDAEDENGIIDETNEEVTTPEADGEDTDEETSGGGYDVIPEEGDEVEEDIPEVDEKEPEEAAPSTVENSVMEAGEYGTLQNGNFDSGSTGWELVELALSKDSGLVKSGQCLYKWGNGSVSAKQTIANVKPGIYQVSLDAGGSYKKDTFALKIVDSQEKELANNSLDTGVAWGVWKTYTSDAFVITEENNSSLTITIEGTLDSTDFHLDNVVMEELPSYNLVNLQELYDQASKLSEDCYTSGSWTALEAAMDTADKLLKASSDDTVAITVAYTALQKAMNELVVEATLYYYVPDLKEGEEVVVTNWSESEVTFGDAALAGDSGKIQSGGYDKVAHKMVVDDTYTQWYSIPVTCPIGGDSSSNDFEIDIYDGSKLTKLIQISEPTSWNNNSGIYAKLASGSESVYAVKGYTCYSGSELVTAIMRQATLYVYSTGDVPAIMVEGGTLSKVNEDSAELEELDADDYDDGYKKDNHYYSMTKDEKVANWYYLTFTAPDVSGKMFGLYSKADKDAWVKDFVNRTAEGDWEVDFTPVFEGKIYYKDGVFSDSRSTSLGMLKDLLAEAQAIQEKGQGGYTQASWQTLETAISGANTLISQLETAGRDDSYTDDDAGGGSTAIADAYAVLESAINGLEVIATLYYYAGADATAAGMTFWWNDAEQPISTNAQKTTDWHGWNSDKNTTYQMTKETSGISGWFKIQLSIKNNGGNDAGFAVHKYDGKSSSVMLESSKLWAETDIYAKLVSGEETAYAIKNSRCFAGQDLIDALMRSVTLYVYDSEGIPAIGTSAKLSYVDEVNTSLKEVEDSEEKEDVFYHKMKADTENANWYYLTFSAPKADTSTKKIAGLYSYAASESGEEDADPVYTYNLIQTFVEGDPSSTANKEMDFTPVFTKYNGKVYYQGGNFYATRPATLDELKKLVAEAEQLKADEEDETKTPKYLHNNTEWQTFTAKLTEAKSVIAKNEEGTDKPTISEIDEAYSALEKAMKALVPVSIESENIIVDRVPVDDDFITGADLSSYVSLKESGVVFKDQNGKALSDPEFFKYLYDGGTNWVRVRIWNDPYNSANGGGYGGGNSDLERAIIIGKLATDAGMKVLIDFHYSDFWADPAKQDAPKAWKNYTIEQKVEAVKKYTLDSLNELADAGVNVGMVQVGNETNNGICGENSWGNMAKIFNAGSRAVRQFAAERNQECLVAIHFAEPQDEGFVGLAGKLRDNGVDYDVFASSYYPFWHGTTENLYNVLKKVATDYNKKVMVAETSWVTTWEDGDGHGNSAPKITQELAYSVSLQGQADEIRDVMANVAAVNNAVPGAAIGMFYWEPAWISPYYVYNADGSIDQSLYKKNKEAWEKYGSGWASSYSIEYDPTDAGLWYGGSAVDNQAWFDFDGTALETTQIYKYIRTAATPKKIENKISNVMSNITKEYKVGDVIEWPSTVDVAFNTGDFVDGKWESKHDVENPITGLAVEWDKDQKDLVNTDKTGQYSVNGIVKCTYNPESGSDAVTTEYFNITLTITVVTAGNILENPGFEKSDSSYDPWKVNNKNRAEVSIKGTADGVRTGNYGLHFWGGRTLTEGYNLDFTASQTVTGLKPGTYTFGGYIQGGGAADTDLQYAYVEVYDKNSNKKLTYKTSCSLGGYLNWMNPEISGIKVETGDYLVVGMEVKTSKEFAWGTIDDMYLYGSYGIDIDNGIQNGKVTVNTLEADNKDVIKITATPNNGCYLTELTVSGEGVTDSNINLKGDGGSLKSDAAEGEAVLEFNKEVASRSDATMTASFNMPNTNVKISAKFVSIFGETGKVDLKDDNVTVEGFELVGTPEAGKYVYKYPLEYTGKNIELDLAITYSGYKLTTADYTVKYAKNKNVTTDDAMAEITLKAKGTKFEGNRTLYFKIVDTKVDISTAKVVLNPTKESGFDGNKDNNYYYTGDYIEPTVKQFTDKQGASLKNKEGADLSIVENTDYTVKYLNNIKVGKATIMVIAKEGSTKIKGSVTQTFTIAKRPISDESITIFKPSGGTYTGSKITPNVTVKYGNTVLQKGKDYKVTYYNNKNVSTNVTDPKKLPYLKITGVGNYTGSTDTYNGTKDKITFVISEKSINDISITAVAGDLAHNNDKELALKLTVKDGKKSLSANKQYRVQKIALKEDTGYKTIYECDKDGKPVAGSATNPKVKGQGTYQVTLKGLGSYTDERKLTFKVISAEYILSNAQIAKIDNQVYTGSPITFASQDLKVTNKKGATVASDQYTVTCTNNIKAGTATVTIKARNTGSYVGTKSTTFKIVKRAIAVESKLTAAQEQKKKDLGLITYEFAEEEDIYKNGSEYLYPYTGYSWTPNLKIYSTNNGVKKLLTKGVDYTISFKNNQKANDKLAAGKYASITITGKGSYSGKVTFADVFKVKDVTLDDFVITINPVAYTGKAIKPAITFVYKPIGRALDLKAGTAYTVKYKNNTKAASLKQSGTTDKNGKPVALNPYVLITEKGLHAYKQNEAGGYVACKSSDKKNVQVDFTITTATITSASIADIKPQTYNGKPAKPSVTIKVNGRKLKAGTDYLVTYTGNVGRSDSAKVTVVGIGNYSGKAEKIFVIK